MITILDIQTAIAKALKDNGFTVIANEVKEGFTKPACFIDVLPVQVELQNQFEELITDSIEITYFPQVETRESLVTASEQLKNIFLYHTLPVKDRFLSINGITFDADNGSLIAQFDIEYLQETNFTQETLPKMEEYEERVICSGASTDTD